MAFAKSTLIGIVAFLIASIAYILIAMNVFLRRHGIPRGTHVAFTPVWLFGNPLYWLISLAAFAAGFYWSFHRS